VTYDATQKLKEEVRKRFVDARITDPLVDRMLLWIDGDELWAACEAVGMVKANYGSVITPQQIKEQALDVLERNLRDDLG